MLCTAYLIDSRMFSLSLSLSLSLVFWSVNDMAANVGRQGERKKTTTVCLPRRAVVVFFVRLRLAPSALSRLIPAYAGLSRFIPAYPALSRGTGL